MSIAWAEFLSWRLVLLFTKQQQTNEENSAVTSHLHQTIRLIFLPFLKLARPVLWLKGGAAGGWISYSKLSITVNLV